MELSKSILLTTSLKMNKIALIFCLTLINFGFSQDTLEGNWYLVSRNNYRVIHITSDSIFMHTTDGFTLNETDHFDPTESYKILDKKKVGDTTYYEAKRYLSDTVLMSFWKDGNLTSSNLMFDVRSISQLNFEPIYLKLVQETEIKSFQNLKNISEMTVEDFLKFTDQMLILKNETKRLTRQYLFSEVKYMLADLGYDPRIKLSSLTDRLEKYANLEETKTAYDAVFNQ